MRKVEIRQVREDAAAHRPRDGYCRILALLWREGWQVRKDRMERIRRQGGLKVPQKQPKRGCLWLNEGSCIRLRPEYRNHVWSYDFVQDRTHDGKTFRMLTVLEEYSRESLAIDVKRRLNSENVLDRLAQLFVERGTPDYIRSDQGPELPPRRSETDWLRCRSSSEEVPWENGYIESFNGKLRDELLDREIFYTLKEAKVLIENWRWEYNHFRPHSGLGYRPPAPVAIELPPLRLVAVLT